MIEASILESGTEVDIAHCNFLVLKLEHITFHVYQYGVLISISRQMAKMYLTNSYICEAKEFGPDRCDFVTKPFNL
jgi:hypothetical protein